MINSIIFSKDRACQCDLTLQSLWQNSDNLLNRITVLYTASTEEFDKGYAKLKEYWKSSINFVNQSDFQQDVVKLTQGSEPFTVYFTDDDIFYRRLKKRSSVFILRDPQFCCFSLRLGKNITVQDCHRGVPCLQPDFSTLRRLYNEDVLSWDWTKLPSHTNFAYPLSVDGHIFETNLLLKYVDEFEYDNPNSFEGRLQQFNQKMPPKMACFTESHIVNTPLNRVQETCTNLAGQHYPADPESLNDYFLQNYRIDLKKMNFSNTIGCHQEIQLHLTKGSE
jgi:hypothetical protein